MLVVIHCESFSMSYLIQCDGLCRGICADQTRPRPKMAVWSVVVVAREGLTGSVFILHTHGQQSGKFAKTLASPWTAVAAAAGQRGEVMLNKYKSCTMALCGCHHTL